MRTDGLIISEHFVTLETFVTTLSVSHRRPSFPAVSSFQPASLVLVAPVWGSLYFLRLVAAVNIHIHSWIGQDWSADT